MLNEMILSARLKEHLSQPLALWVGSRDSDFRPEGVRAVMVDIRQHNILRLFVQKEQAEQTIHNLRDNKRISLASVDPATLESYQFKGTFIKVGDVTDDEVERIDELKVLFNEVLLNWGLPDGIVNNLPIFPAVAIEFEIDQIFDQTPKQGTGQLISAMAGR